MAIETVPATRGAGVGLGYKPIIGMRTRDMFTLKGESIPLPKEFNDDLKEHVQRYTKMRKPFCARCAREDWKTTYLGVLGDARSKTTEIDEEDIITLNKISSRIGSLEKYGSDKRFKLLQESEDSRTVSLGIDTRAHIIDNIKQHFQCQIRGERFTVFVPLKLWEKRTGKKWKSYDETADIEMAEKLAVEAGKQK